MSRFLSTLSFVLLLSLSLHAEPRTLVQWTFDSPDAFKGWSSGQVADVKVENGALRFTVQGVDPMLISPPIQLDAGRWQAVEFRLKTDAHDGTSSGELFFTNTDKGPFGGFSGTKLIRWTPIADGAWHEYRLFPLWDAERKIVKFRLDFPRLAPENLGKRSAELAWIRVVDYGPLPETADLSWDFRKADLPFRNVEGASLDKKPGGWEVTTSESGGGFLMSDPFKGAPGGVGDWVSIALEDVTPGTGVLRFAASEGPFGEVPFPIHGPGVCNIDMSEQPGWDEAPGMIGIKVGNRPGDKAVVRAIRISDRPQGPARIAVSPESPGLTEGINRVGQVLPFEIRLVNIGGKTGEVDALFELPDGLKKATDDADGKIVVEPGRKLAVVRKFTAEKPVDGAIRVRIRDAAGKELANAEFDVSIGPSLNLPKADYVPVPKPVESDYDISALYYAGWYVRWEWDRIEKCLPIRKPILGWYDEANPECIDWQIKWAAENGIRNFFVCWYWNKGAQHKNHWVDNFPKAKHKRFLKWCVMWANHNGPGSHSEEDQARVTDYWIEHFFKTPEYYTIDGKPVVLIWSPRGMDEDIRNIERKKGNELKKGEGVKRLLDLSRRKAVEAGLKGIYFMGMKFPEESTTPEDVHWLAEAGFEETSIYRYMGTGGKTKDPRRYDFKLVADASPEFWRAWHQTSTTPFMPSVTTGWDDRPWKNGREIHGRTVPLFRQILNDYKEFAAETGIKRVMLGPMTEWGEGSYIEPNREYGFGMYEAIRETLCKKPEAGWPLNYGPVDVGLGPYDLPPTPESVFRDSWDFSDGMQGWRAGGQIERAGVKDGRLALRSIGTDPILSVDTRLEAGKYEAMIVRMKVSSFEGDASVQLFWKPRSGVLSEASSIRLPLAKTPSFQDYRFNLSENGRWKGRITALRLDPTTLADMACEIEEIRLVPKK